MRLTVPCLLRSYVRLDGSMSQKSREKVVNKLTNHKGSIVLLASLKAGGGAVTLARTGFSLLTCIFPQLDSISALPLTSI